MTVGQVFLAMAGVVLFIVVLVRVVPVLRHGRFVTLAHPPPTSRVEAERAADRLIQAGIAAEVAEGDDHLLNLWANNGALGEPRPDERYVVRVPRRQAVAASKV